jgi:hypothetical protein
MIYRKAPARPPRLLLRIVGSASAAALVGAPACGANSGSMGSVACPPDANGTEGCPVNGVAPNQPSDANADGYGAQISGVAPYQPDAGYTQVTGVAPYQPDASYDDVTVINGLVASPHDASDDVLILGLIVHPDGG